MSHINSGYVGVDKRSSKGGVYGLRKHRQERSLGNFKSVVHATPASFSNEYSIDLDGTNDTVEVGSTSDFAFGTSGYSISFWFNGSGTNNPGGFGVNIFDMRGSVSNAAQPSLWIQTKGASSLLKLYVNGLYRVSATATINAGTWYHVVITNDGTTSKIYLNGNSTPIATGADSQDYVAAPLKIGGYVGNNYYFSGYIDEFAIFSSALSTSNIASIYNNGVPNDLSSLSPLGWWRMGENDGGSGTTITDQGSGGNNGTLTNGPTFSSETPVFNQHSVEFDGTDDYIAIGTSAIDLDTNFTISCWFRSDYHGGYVPIGGWGDFASGKLRMMQILSGLSFEIWGSRVTGSTTILTNTWYHAAVTFSGNDVIIYLNGSQDGSGTLSRNSFSSSTTFIGGHPSLTASGFSEFDGEIDEFAVFSSVLSASQIENIYNSGTPDDLSSLSPLGWWRMGDNDGGSGTTITDQGSGGNNGTLTNGATIVSEVPS